MKGRRNHHRAIEPVRRQPGPRLGENGARDDVLDVMPVGADTAHRRGERRDVGDCGPAPAPPLELVASVPPLQVSRREPRLRHMTGRKRALSIPWLVVGPLLVNQPLEHLRRTHCQSARGGQLQCALAIGAVEGAPCRPDHRYITEPRR